MKEAIIIISIFFGSRQTVYFTDKYAFKETEIYDFSTPGIYKIKDTIYEIFDFDKEVVHRISVDEKNKTSLSLEYLNKHKIKTAFQIRRHPVIKTRYQKRNYDMYHCNDRIETFRYTVRESVMSIEKTYDHHYYFAKSNLLDSTLNTPDKFEFAGFVEQLDDPYKYLVYQFISKEKDSNIIVKSVTVDKGLLDTSLMMQLLKLPQENRFLDSNGN